MARWNKVDTTEYMTIMLSMGTGEWKGYCIRENGYINWLVFRMLMFEYFNIKDGGKFTKAQFKFISEFAKENREE